MPIRKIGILHAIENEPDQFRSYFEAVKAPFEYQIYKVTEGEFPNSVWDCEAFIVSGSAKGVYDPDPWIARVSDFVKISRREQRKLVGVCFGHQLIAHALGGHAEKSDRGWGLGLNKFKIETPKPWMEPALDTCSLYFAHQDQVTVLPDGAERLAGNDVCPNAIYAIDDQVLGIQGHPEFSTDFMTYVLGLLQERVGPELYGAAQSSLNAPGPDAKTVAHWIINFINV